MYYTVDSSLSYHRCIVCARAILQREMKRPNWKMFFTSMLTSIENSDIFPRSSIPNICDSERIYEISATTSAFTADAPVCSSRTH